MPSTGMLIVFGLIAVALVLFVTELIPNDITAIGILVSLAVLQPYTGVSARDAISGFASPATVTIIAMYILSAGIQNTGVVERIGTYIGRLTKGKELPLLSATIGSTGVSAGIINNTPVVAVFIPMVTNLAKRFKISPSRLLLPLSYAAMLGGTLTLIGTSTNILASDLAYKLLGSSISMFEFTHLGLIVFTSGCLYLLTVGRWLIPDRIDPDEGLVDEFALNNQLVYLKIKKNTDVIGDTGEELSHRVKERDVDLLEIRSNGDSYQPVSTDRLIASGDLILVRGKTRTINQLINDYGLTRTMKDIPAEELEEEGGLVEVVLPSESAFIGKTARELKLEETFDTTLLSIRRGEELISRQVDAVHLEKGDNLLLQSNPEVIDYLTEQGDMIWVEGMDVTEHTTQQEPDEDEPLHPKTPIAMGIMIGVIGAAATGLLPIVIAALAGVFCMVVTGCITPHDIYDAVSWNIIFLLAGVLPLGVAMQQTGGDAYIGELIRTVSSFFPVYVALFLFCVITGLLANVITPVASVVLMIPIAVDAAVKLGASEYTFLITVMFAASSAFMTPIGYQTNLMVYGPGGYKFIDYLHVGGPLQLLQALVTTAGAIYLFGL